MLVCGQWPKSYNHEGDCLRPSKGHYTKAAAARLVRRSVGPYLPLSAAVVPSNLALADSADASPHAVSSAASSRHRSVSRL